MLTCRQYIGINDEERSQNSIGNITVAESDTMADRNTQQRKDEILAKKAKLAELKRQRELRQKEFSHNRMTIGEPTEVRELP